MGATSRDILRGRITPSLSLSRDLADDVADIARLPRRGRNTPSSRVTRVTVFLTMRVSAVSLGPRFRPFADPAVWRLRHDVSPVPAAEPPPNEVLWGVR